MGRTKEELTRELCKEYEMNMGFYENGTTSVKEDLDNLAFRLRNLGIIVDSNDSDNSEAGKWLDDNGY